MLEDLRNVVRSSQTLEEKENALLEIFRICISRGDYSTVGDTFVGLKELWKDVTTPRIIKITKLLFEIIPYTAGDFDEILGLLDRLVAWADEEEKRMLALELECKRLYALLKTGRYEEMLEKAESVIQELKKYDDKLNLITIHVYQSKAFYELGNVQKSKSCLISARILAVSAYCPPRLQAQIDMLGGIYICNEGSYGLASSYFIEALEGFTLDKMYIEACLSVRYLILSKIAAGKHEEMNVILKNKSALRHLNDGIVKLLFEVCKACRKRDLGMYNRILLGNAEQIHEDPFVLMHLQRLYEVLLDRNIVKVVEPYSVVRIGFVANVLGFEEHVVEEKLRRMILDQKIHGVLDHVTSCLILQEKRTAENVADEYTKQIRMLEHIVTLSGH